MKAKNWLYAERMAFSPSKRVCVIGLGNVLMGDDGFGPLAVERFRCEYQCGPNVEVLDLGTPGLDLAPYLFGMDLVVIADAVNADEKPGTLSIYCEADLVTHRAQLRLSDHDPGLQESLAHLRLSGATPSELIIVGAVPESCDFGKGISPSVLRASSVAVESIAGLLIERGIRCSRRHAALRPNLWWLSEDGSEFVLPRSKSQNQAQTNNVGGALGQAVLAGRVEG
ncbi:MAG TPA: hydrogenase maturation protease [Terriglobales bacterium]|nr:hydrogenase maturation protease [Dongiaceae bacterium]HVO64590.1 hydrogenase maturation protease [Terriglobales bacterium]